MGKSAGANPFSGTFVLFLGPVQSTVSRSIRTVRTPRRGQTREQEMRETKRNAETNRVSSGNVYSVSNFQLAAVPLRCFLMTPASLGIVFRLLPCSIKIVHKKNPVRFGARMAVWIRGTRRAPLLVLVLSNCISIM